MTGDVNFEKIFGDGYFVLVDPTERIDLNDVIPCLPPMCPPVQNFTVIREEAPAAEATEAPCTCY